MRGRQINYFIQSNELETFNGFLEESDWLIVNMDSPDGSPVFAQSIVKKDKSEFVKVFLVRKDDLGKLKFRFIEKLAKYKVDDSKGAQLVELFRPYFNETENLLRSGRLYYQKAYFNQQDEPVEKPEGFVKAAEKLFRSFRKTFKNAKHPDFKGFLVTQNTIDLTLENNVVLSEK